MTSLAVYTPSDAFIHVPLHATFCSKCDAQLEGTHIRTYARTHARKGRGLEPHSRHGCFFAFYCVIMTGDMQCADPLFTVSHPTSQFRTVAMLIFLKIVI
jgi:hypothetical protein